jgi:hypothetical protein
MKKEHKEWLKHIVMPSEMHKDFIDYLEGLDANEEIKKQSIVTGEMEYAIYKPGEPILLGQNKDKLKKP